MIATEPKPIVAEKGDAHRKAFARLAGAGAPRPPAWLSALREAGFARFSELGFPTLRQEDWRFTNVAPIAKLPFKPALEPADSPLTAADLAAFALADVPGPRLVFLDGHYAAGLSLVPTPQAGIWIGSLARALAEDLEVLKHLGGQVRSGDDAFAALNTAFLQDGGVVWLAPGTAVAEPIQLLFVSTGREPGATSHPRTLIVAEKGSRATVIETYVSLADVPTLTNAATEFVLGEQSVVEHIKFQDESTESFHIAALHSQLGAGAGFFSHSIVTGARLSRNNIRTTLDGEGIECVLNGVYLTNGEQLADHHMVVDHARPRCASHEYFNGILAGKSRGVFHGRILVRPGAQKTDAKQTSKNLLLSDDASADAKPQLEIYADDVKCTHGATIGQLNDESVYYLRSRGIGLDTARRMLIHAFAGEIIDRVRHDAARARLDELVWDRLERLESVTVGKHEHHPAPAPDHTPA